MNGRVPTASDAACLEVAAANRDRHALEKEIERLHALLHESAAKARRKQEEAVAELLEVLVEASRREQHLEDALVECAEAIDGLVGIKLGGSADTRAMWRDRLNAAWQARNRAADHLPGQRFGRSLKQAS